jgi:hypothetical protein
MSLHGEHSCPTTSRGVPESQPAPATRTGTGCSRASGAGPCRCPDSGRRRDGPSAYETPSLGRPHAGHHGGHGVSRAVGGPAGRWPPRRRPWAVGPAGALLSV